MHLRAITALAAFVFAAASLPATAGPIHPGREFTAVRPAKGQKVWCVGASGYAGGQAGGTYLFAYCDAAISLPPTNPGCYAQTPYVYGERSVKVSYSASDPCVPGSPPYGTCSGALGTSVKLGKLAVTTTVGTSGQASDPTYVTEGSVQASGFTDQITVTSNTLPNGTGVELQETLELSGSFSFDCAAVGLVDAAYTYDGIAGTVDGSCQNGNFVQTTSQGPGTKESTIFDSQVGATFTIHPTLSAALGIWDCTTRTASGCMSWGSPYSATMNVRKALYHLAPITSNVTLVSASGQKY